MTNIRSWAKSRLSRQSAHILGLLLIVTHMGNGQSQQNLPEVVSVTARPSPDSIVLRWAPANFNVWRDGNHYGYKVERYTLARDGSLLPIPGKRILHNAIKPIPEAQWEDLVADDKYAAIAAQALYGETFEIDIRNSDVFTIVNKVRENEQRCAFALFSADMSPSVARASGLMFTDSDVSSGEKYLYRISVNAGDSLRGSIFVSPADRYQLPKPQHLKADFNGHLVRLKWAKNNHPHYTAYRVERSHDGIHFESISDSPLVTVSPVEGEDTRFHYAIDSLRDLRATIHFRVKGITPFGEEGPVSDVVRGSGVPAVKEVPYISTVENVGNESLLIQWHFSSDDENAVTGFTLERAPHATGNFISINPQPLAPVARSFKDHAPEQVNYYRVVAMGKDGTRHLSPVYYGQLIDSIPPASPKGLQAKTSASGVVELSWEPNAEADLYGYRVYASHYRSEEPVQLTTGPIRQPFFTDTVALKTLNEYAYYRVMAIDRNQNHSTLSAILEVPLPDQVPPQPPVMLPVRCDRHGVQLSWMPGPSADVTRYTIYRKKAGDPGWKQIGVVAHNADSIYHHRDADLPAGEVHLYTVLSIDDAGLESVPGIAIAGNRIDNSPEPPITWRNPLMLREENQITLRWNHAAKDRDIECYRIYKALSGQPSLLYKTASADTREFKDRLIPTEDYTYHIMAVFTNGRKSDLSEGLFVDY